MGTNALHQMTSPWGLIWGQKTSLNPLHLAVVRKNTTVPTGFDDNWWYYHDFSNEADQLAFIEENELVADLNTVYVGEG